MSGNLTPASGLRVLYHDWDSIQSIKVRLCLFEKDLPFTSCIVSLRHFEHLRPDYLALNPAGLVPTLRDGDRIIVESSRINEHLDALSAHSPLLPQDEMQRAAVRRWCKLEDEEMHPAVRAPTFHLMIKQRFASLSRCDMERLVAHHPQPVRARAYVDMATGPVDHQAVRDSLLRCRELARMLEHSLQDHAWLAGETYTLADVAATAFVVRMDALLNGALWAGLPRTDAWVQALKSRPSFCRAVPDVEHRLPAPSGATLRAVFAHLGSVVSDWPLPLQVKDTAHERRRPLRRPPLPR